MYTNMTLCWMRTHSNYSGLWSLFLVRASVVNIINQAISSRRQDLGLNRLVDCIPYTLQTLECGGGEWRLAVVYWISLRKPISIDSCLEWSGGLATPRQSFLCLPIYPLCNRSPFSPSPTFKAVYIGKTDKTKPSPQVSRPNKFSLNFGQFRTKLFSGKDAKEVSTVPCYLITWIVALY